MPTFPGFAREKEVAAPSPGIPQFPRDPPSHTRSQKPSSCKPQISQSAAILGILQAEQFHCFSMPGIPKEFPELSGRDLGAQAPLGMRLCAADVILQLLQTFLQRSEDPEFHGNHNKILLWSHRDASGMSKTKSSPAKPIPNGIRAGKMRLRHRTAAGPGPAPFPAGEFPEPVLTLWSWDSIQAPGKTSRSRAGSGRRAWIGIQIFGKMRELGLEPQDPPRGPKALEMKFPQNQARFGKFFKLASPHLWPQFLGKRGFSEFSTRSEPPSPPVKPEILGFLFKQLLFNRSPE